MRSGSSVIAMALLAGCTYKGGDTGITGVGATSDSQVDGVVFKGPMDAGGTVTLQPVTPLGEIDGDPVETTVADDGGSYSATVPTRGLVLVEAYGTTFDEARGEDGSESIHLYGYAQLDSDARSLYVNTLTDLAHLRVKALLAEGTPPEVALPQALDELIDALHIGVGERPDEDGDNINPFEDNGSSSVLFAVSAVVAQAGLNLEEEGYGSLPEVQDGIRIAVEAGDALPEDLAKLLYDAEEQLDPDLAALSLAGRIEDAAVEGTLPNLHPALDSDHDGLPNDKDNCRYVFNDDQTDSLGLGFGDVCDERLISISTTMHWGCGVRIDSGQLVCWQVDAPPTGGSPPRPDTFPVHILFPWEDADFLGGPLKAVEVTDNAICAIDALSGDLRCWLEDAAEEVQISGDFQEVRVGGSLACGIDSDGALTCADNENGDVLISDPGPFVDVDILGSGSVVAISAFDGSLGWVDYTGEPSAPPELPTGAFAKVSASGADWGCAVSATDGSLSCFGSNPLAESAPTGSFSEIAVGDGLACAVETGGDVQCWRDAVACPAEFEPEPGWGAPSVGGCQACGLDDRSLGACGPRYWDQARAERD